MPAASRLSLKPSAVCDGLAMGHEGMRYSLCSRELIADSVEVMLTAHPLDAVVFIPNCDKVVPGMLMAACRLNLPSIFVSGGPMLPAGTIPSNSAFRKCSRLWVPMPPVKSTTRNCWPLKNLPARAAAPCSGMYTANSMNCLTEAIGLALPGNGSIPAVLSARIALAKDAGEQVLELLRQDLRPRDILTEKAFENALRSDMALGCSSNTVLHLLAIAHEAGVAVDMQKIDQISRTTPQLCKLNPASQVFITDLNDVGGIPIRT